MNHEAISQACIVERFEVRRDDTARSVFAGLPFGATYAARMHDVLSSASLLAQLESICITAIERQIDWPRERVLGRRMQFEHRGAASVGERVEVNAYVIGLGERSVQFHVEARAGARSVAQGVLEFVVVPALCTSPDAGANRLRASEAAAAVAGR